MSNNFIVIFADGSCVKFPSHDWEEAAHHAVSISLIEEKQIEAIKMAASPGSPDAFLQIG